MIRTVAAVATMSVLGLSASIFTRSRNPADLVDRVQGVRVGSRIPCDGSTNPEEELTLETTFSPAGWQRSFHLDVFESQYCKYVNVYFFCAWHGRDRWKHEWVADSQGAPAPRTWIKSCSAWQSKDAPEYILSGWYREGTAAANKPAWKQAAVKQVSATPEIYEFTDPNGGTARVEIKRK